MDKTLKSGIIKVRRTDLDDPPSMLDLTTIRCGLRAYFAPNFKVAVSACIALVIAIRLYQIHSRRSRTTKLKGPPSKSFLLGVTKDIFDAYDPGAVWNDWEKTYGSTYEINGTLGSKMVVVGDPKAIAHVFAKDTTIYHQLTFFKVLTRRSVSPAISV